MPPARSRALRRLFPLNVLALTALAALAVPTAQAGSTAAQLPITKTPTAIGTGGAVATVDTDATRIGVDVLRGGGNAVDAAVATAAALGVTEPFSAGIGGGGFFVYYDAATHTVHTIDGRETAPLRMTSTSFTENGRPLAFSDAVASGLSVGVPGSPATWQTALDLWGTRSLAESLRPAIRLAKDGFLVDQTFHDQDAAQTRFTYFAPTAELYRPGGQPPAVGSTFRNPDLARTYQQLAAKGMDWLYRGKLADEIVETVQHPPLAPGVTYYARPGLMELGDLDAYRTIQRQPTHVSYRGLDVYGMAPASSGGSTVGEALKILSNVDLSSMTRTEALHYYVEASARAFADRAKYVGDPAYVDVPLDKLLSDDFAKQRFCTIDPTQASAKPVPAGDVNAPSSTTCPSPTGTVTSSHEGLSTTNMTISDRWGNVVEYTLTIEQTGGSGIVVPNRGFLLNNELTDFNFAPALPGDPNLPAPGKRPRSSISPTIVLQGGHPYLAVGSPGGATIITTVLQILLDRLDLGYSLPAAIADARVSSRNGAAGLDWEPAFDRSGLLALGHKFAPNPAEIGAATAIEFRPDGSTLAAAEPVRRGGGSAAVVTPTP